MVVNDDSRFGKGAVAAENDGVLGPARVSLSYPLLLRTEAYTWWKPMSGVLLLLFGVVVLVPVVLMPVLAVAVTLQGGTGSFGDRFAASMRVDQVTPASMLYLNLTLASLTVLAMLIVRGVHGSSPRWLVSVLPGPRWRFFGACLGAALVALAVSQGVGALVPSESGNAGQAAVPTGQLLATAAVILLTTPLQALGEEYAFRGYLMQAFGSMFRSRAVAVFGTSLLFAFAHGTQNLPLFLDRFTFGLMAGLTVVLVGGLEAGIALHVVNNVVAFGIAVAYDRVSGALNVAEVSWWQIPQTIAQNGVFLLLVLLIVRRMKVSNTVSIAPAQTVSSDRH